MKSLAELLKTGRPLLGVCVMYPSPGVVERIGPDWDWVWIDGQHGEIDYHESIALVRACDLIQRPSVVRVPSHEAGAIGKVLDMGATGVMVPQVNTPEEARAVVAAAKFPPVGERSYGGRRPIDMLGRTYSHTANQDTVLIVQIETPRAVENADQIAAVPGVDVLFLGPDNIMLRRGTPMDAPRPKDALVRELDAVGQACRKHGKVAAMVGASAEMLTLCLEKGFQLFVSGGDVPFLANGSKAASSAMRAVVKGIVPASMAGGTATAANSPY